MAPCTAVEWRSRTTSVDGRSPSLAIFLWGNWASFQYGGWLPHKSAPRDSKKGATVFLWLTLRVAYHHSCHPLVDGSRSLNTTHTQSKGNKLTHGKGRVKRLQAQWRPLPCSRSCSLTRLPDNRVQLCAEVVITLPWWQVGVLDLPTGTTGSRASLMWD